MVYILANWENLRIDGSQLEFSRKYSYYLLKQYEKDFANAFSAGGFVPVCFLRLVQIGGHLSFPRQYSENARGQKQKTVQRIGNKMAGNSLQPP